MTEQNKRFLDDSRVYYDTLERTGMVRDINFPAMLEVYQEEFDPGFRLREYSMTAMCALIKKLYTSYDRWLAENQQEVK